MLGQSLESPEERARKEERKLAEDVMLKCQRSLKATLKDPKSYELIDWKYGLKNGTMNLTIQYRAKNSFGGYAVDLYTCTSKIK